MRIRHRRRLQLALKLVLGILVFNAVFVRLMEGWSWIDSFYFSVVTFTTIGYGDLTPSSPVTKLALTFSLLATFFVFLYSFSLLTHIRIRAHVSQAQKKLEEHVEKTVEEHVEKKVDKHVEKTISKEVKKEVQKEVKEARVEVKLINKSKSRPKKKTSKKRTKKKKA